MCKPVSAGKIFQLLFVLGTLWLVNGCATYYGYDDIRENVFSDYKTSDEAIKNFVVVYAADGDVRLRCFSKYDKIERMTVDYKIVGRREYYKEFEGSYYLDEPALNPLKNWDFVIGKAYGKSFLKTLTDGNPLLYLIPWVGQFALAVDMVLLGGGGMIDLTVVTGCSCYSMIAWPSYWLGGRLFGWMGDWQLAEHKPNFFTMLSYMPFVNLFFPFQTPPYMASRPKGKEIRDSKYEELLRRTEEKRVIKQQRVCFNNKVSVEISGGGNRSSITARSLRDGTVDLSLPVRQMLRNLPKKSKYIKLNITLFDSEGKRVLLTRECKLDVSYLTPISARQDWVSYNSAEIDTLNRVLLRNRAHRFWKRELLGEDFRRLQKLSLRKKRK